MTSRASSSSSTTDGSGEAADQLPASPDATRGRAGSENFPVAARLLPGRFRRHLMALYSYARLVDYAGDEAPGDRLALLDAIEADVDRVYDGHPRIRELRALQTTVRECAVPRAPLVRLIEANRRDQRVRRYRTFAELLDYCALSADPVGELVLHLFGCATPDRIALSDRVCTALQILEHCQDVAEDHAAGRVYLPAEDLARHGCGEQELAAPRASPAVRRVVALQVARARHLLAEGEPLIGRLPLPARIAVSGYLAGGRATAAALAAVDYDVLGNQVRPRPTRVLVEWARLAAPAPVRGARAGRVGGAR
ncbi:MAG: squalene synthase HpnC [Pseudonocardia sp.]|nr:squalene synthase HpnC [Pseudonocardia sp.]